MRSDKIKELLVGMLQVSEKDRYSWEQLFAHEVVRAEEATIKQNMESLIKDKEDIIKSSALDRLYSDNLVAAYIQNPKEVQEALE